MRRGACIILLLAYFTAVSNAQGLAALGALGGSSGGLGGVGEFFSITLCSSNP